MTRGRATKVTDLRDLRSEDWGTLQQHDQSRYVEGVCERCGNSIATGERHLVRHWLRGPAELCQHIICPDEEGT